MRNPELYEYANKIAENCRQSCKAWADTEHRCPFYVVLPNSRGNCRLSGKPEEWPKFEATKDKEQ